MPLRVELSTPKVPDSKAYKPQSERVQAVGPTKIQDPIIDCLCQQAEQAYEPKVKRPGEWLDSFKEKGQPIANYSREASKVIKWSSADYNTIVLYIMDEGVPQDMIDALKTYCDAFFTDCRIEIRKGGESIPGGKKLPKDFFTEHRIKMRDDRTDPDRQAYTVDVLNRLVQYKGKSTYAILGVTTLDLYPGINFNYVFGWANFGSGTGVFSFRRYHPQYFKWYTHSYQDYLRLACHTMAHECCHMFGMHHCPYYECLMNGYNSLEEQIERKNNTLCPVCLKKLKLNVNFDTRKRFENLLAAVQKLGFS